MNPTPNAVAADGGSGYSFEINKNALSRFDGALQDGMQVVKRPTSAAEFFARSVHTPGCGARFGFGGERATLPLFSDRVPHAKGRREATALVLFENKTVVVGCLEFHRVLSPGLVCQLHRDVRRLAGAQRHALSKFDIL